jgi:hypothetical protein
MNKSVGVKPKFKEESIINWSVVSKILTGKKENIRQNRVPKKHKKEIEQLLFYIESWENNKILISPEKFKEKIRNLDLISIILDEN